MSDTLVLRLVCLGDRQGEHRGCDRECGRVYLRDGRFVARLHQFRGGRVGDVMHLEVDLLEPAAKPPLSTGDRPAVYLGASCGRCREVNADPAELLRAARSAAASRTVRVIPLPRSTAL